MPQPKTARKKPDAQAADTPDIVVNVMTALRALAHLIAMFGTDKHSERAFRLLNLDKA